MNFSLRRLDLFNILEYIHVWMIDNFNNSYVFIIISSFNVVTRELTRCRQEEITIEL
jgi:hypothetical protein